MRAYNTDGFTFALALCVILTPLRTVFFEKLTISQVVKRPRILWIPKVHYRNHKSPPPVSILADYFLPRLMIAE